MSFEKFEESPVTPLLQGGAPGVPFSQLNLHPALSRAVADAGYELATEVQAEAIPPAMEGRDLMVSSRTGSGKTASFILPALEKILLARGDSTKRRQPGLVSGPRILVLTPTRELAMQVAKAASTYGRHVQGLRVTTVVGGVPYPAQIKALRGPLDILIATPGRLIDHLQTGKAVLENVEMLVLDEADRMLDMGFIDDITTIADHVPAERQTVMYSATFAGHVGRLAQSLLREPQRIEVASHTETHVNIEQRLHWADNPHHKNALLDHILTTRDVDQAVVFTSTQRDADWLADRLADMGHACAALHGGMPQGRRNRVLQSLRNRQLRILVATDVAARGIDVPTISHVINYGLPMKCEDYVHRIGRTGRAGRQGLAVTLAERMDAGMIRRIQCFTTQDIPVTRITGLEPKMPEPRLMPSRGKPGSHGKSFSPRETERGFSRAGSGRGASPDHAHRGFVARGEPRSARFEGRPLGSQSSSSFKGGAKQEFRALNERPSSPSAFDKPRTPEGSSVFDRSKAPKSSAFGARFDRAEGALGDRENRPGAQRRMTNKAASRARTGRTGGSDR